MRLPEIFKVLPYIKYTEIQAYLRGTGWRRIPTPKSDIVLFAKEENNLFYEAMLPLSRDFADYEKGIYNVIELIAKSENREIGQVITDLILPPGDIVRFRINNRETISGTIPFVDGFNLFEGAKKSLFTSACDFIQPQLYHKRLSFKGAQQFIEKCRLGQTDKGSFIASVICPFINQTPEEEPLQLSIFNSEEEYKMSFTRHVTTRLMKSLLRVKNAIDLGELEQLSNPANNFIISGNFLESILDLNLINEDTEIEISTTFSSFAPAPDQTLRSVKFTSDYIPALEIIINKLKPKDQGMIDEFIGKVSSTKADPDPNTRNEGEIVFNFMGYDEKIVKARVTLNSLEYSKACEAHIDGRTVRIKGKLISSGRSKIIEDPIFETL